MKIDFIKKELDALLDINKDTIEQLIEREERLQDVEEKSKGMLEMSLKFQKSSKELIPWYHRYQYQIGGVSVSIITLVAFLF